MKRHYEIETPYGRVTTELFDTVPAPTTSPEEVEPAVLEISEDSVRRRQVFGLDPRVVIVRIDEPTEAELAARWAIPDARQAD